MSIETIRNAYYFTEKSVEYSRAAPDGVIADFNSCRSGHWVTDPAVLS